MTEHRQSDLRQASGPRSCAARTASGQKLLKNGKNYSGPACAASQPNEQSSLDTADFRIDFASKQVTRDGQLVRLTPTQWHIVEVLVHNSGRLVTYEQILREVWGPSYGKETNYLRVFMTQIRQKLEPDHTRPRYFITEPGIGFRFEPNEADSSLATQ